MARGAFLLLLYRDEILKKISSEFPKIDRDLVEIILYGSVARDDFTPLSDIDILILTNNKQKTEELFSDFKFQIYLETCIVISTKYLTPAEFEISIEPLYKTIRKEGKSLWK